MTTLICATFISVSLGASAVSAQLLDSVSFDGEPPLDEAWNLAAAALDLATGADAGRLIDGRPADGWMGSAPFDEASPVELVIRLGGRAPVTDILIQPRHWQRGARPPETVEILTSDGAAEGDFVSAGIFRLADAPGWQRLAIAAQAATRVKLRILSVHGSGRPAIGEVAVFAGLPAAVTPVALDEAPVEPIGESGIEPLARSGSNEVLRLSLHGYATSPTYLGQPAPEGTSFLALRGSIANLSAEEPLSLPAVEDVFSLSLGLRGLVRPHEVNRLGAYPFTGPLLIQPDDRRPFTLVFAAPDPLPEETALVFSGTTASALAVALFRETPESTAPLAEAATDTLRLAVTGFDLVPAAGGVEAPAGRQFALVDVRVERLGDQALILALADYAIMVEDGQYVSPPHQATRSLSPHLHTGQRYDPGVLVSGRLGFLVPEDAGDLALVVFMPEGRLVLDLTPELEAGAKPEPIAGPSTGGLVTATLLAASQRQSSTPGKRIVVLDVDLMLNVEEGDVSFTFDPGEALELRDRQGGLHQPLLGAEGLDRALRRTLIWRDQSARGEVAFEVGESASGFTLVIPFRDHPVELVLPDALLPATTVVAVEVPDDEGGGAVAEVEGARVGLAASNVVWASEIEQVRAGPGRRFLSFDLSFANRGADAFRLAVADYLLVVEDDQYTHPVHPLTDETGSALTVADAVQPGQSVAGRLIYELPEETGKLVLVYFGPDGRLELDLTPGVAAAAVPEPVAGPVTVDIPGAAGARLTVMTFDPIAPGPPPPTAAERYIVADFALRLESADPLATLPLDPGALFVLRDEAGREYRPATVPLARAFTRTELWSGQISRGRLAFLVTAGAEAPQALTLEIPGMVSLPLADGAGPAAPVEPVKTVLSLDPTPPAPVQSDGVCKPAIAGGRPDEVFLGEDSVTRGDWPGRYGSEGYVLVSYDGAGQDRSSLPAHLDSYAFSDNTGFYVASELNNDSRILASLSGERFAATAYSEKSFSLTLTAADMAPHTFALYFWDWGGGREQDVAVYDAVTNEILDRRSLANFEDGIYYVYKVQGSVRVELTRTGGINALLSGVFWDPFNPADEANVTAALSNVADGRQGQAVLTVRRGDETIPFTVTGEADRAPRIDSHGLAGRYMTGPGYGRLLVERLDPEVDFSWWREPGGFPDGETVAAEDPLWAEWEGMVTVPWQRRHGVIPLADDQPLGIVIRSSDAGVCIESVEPGSPAEAGGLLAGDIITRVIDLRTRVREKKQVAFRLDAPAGGHLYIDGLRVLATDSAPVEVSLKLDVGERRLRVAALRRASQAVAEEPSEDSPPGPILSWRLPGMSDFEPMPSLALLARPAPGTWRREPRQAAQVGLEWLQSAALEWQRQHNCNGCHVQSQALVAMAIGRDNDYVVSDQAYADLLDGLVRYQNTDGSWHDGFYVTATQFGAMALAAAHRRGKEGRNETFLRAVRFVAEAQSEDGRLPLDHHLPPIDQGDILSTANARIAFSAAAELVPRAEAAAFEDAATKALAWLAAAEPSTNQDRAMRILGLATEDRGSARELLAAARADLLEHQRGDGGWAEVDGGESSAFATGQALYALKVAGQSIASDPFQRGVDWLLDKQLWTGAWASTSETQLAGTMWPVIALVGSFQAVGVEVIAESCLEGGVELVARAVSDETIELVRFVVDGEVVATAREADAEGLYRAFWNAGTVAPGAHELRIEALQEGAVRGEDQTVINTGPIGSRCAGILSVVSTGEPIAGAAAPNIELILDASGSMRERNRRVDGRLKIDVAKELMAETIAGLPDGIMVGLRVYGRTIREGRDGDCTDSELVLPFSRLDKARLIAEVRNVQALGTTPLAYSLVRAARDLAALPGGKLILLVTDGKEECGGSPREVAARLAGLGMTLRVDVVGFALADEAVKREMEQVAEITGGRFFDAQNSEELRRGIQGALAAPYDVLDGEGARAGGGVTGRGAIAVPAGAYTVVVRGVDQEITIANVRVAYGQATAVALTKVGANIETQILGPMAKDEAGWDTAPVDAAGPAPSVDVAPQAPEQLARLNEALDELERALEEARRQPPAPVADTRVREAQQRLTELGFEPGPADGLWGRRTAIAVRAFQEWYPLALPITGELDDPTARAIEEAVARGMKLGAVDPPPPDIDPPIDPPIVPEIVPEIVPVLNGVPSVLDSGTLLIGATVIPLEGVIGGLDGHDLALASYINGRSVDCRPIGARYQCTLSGVNLSKIVLYNGGGRATADARPALKAAEADARDAGRGIWR